MKYSLQRALALTAALAISLAVPAAAQGKTKAEPSGDLVGTWEGNYTSDHAPTGAMRLTIARDSVLKVSALAMAMGHDMMTIPARKLTVSSNEISWVQDMMEQSCQATAVLNDGQMKGTIICGHGAVNFALTKQSK